MGEVELIRGEHDLDGKSLASVLAGRAYRALYFSLRRDPDLLKELADRHVEFIGQSSSSRACTSLMLDIESPAKQHAHARTMARRRRFMHGPQRAAGQAQLDFSRSPKRETN